MPRAFWEFKHPATTAAIRDQWRKEYAHLLETTDMTDSQACYAVWEAQDVYGLHEVISAVGWRRSKLKNDEVFEYETDGWDMEAPPRLARQRPPTRVDQGVELVLNYLDDHEGGPVPRKVLVDLILSELDIRPGGTIDKIFGRYEVKQRRIEYGKYE